ncbi:MAG: LytTR family transcriptional regulator [Bacteroidetes bacterium]|nr:LytTR family transcriptional regulator [Bacteroidota bacterium]
MLIIEAILNTLKIGIFPVIIGIFIEQNRRLRKYVKSANEINRTINNLQKRKSDNNKVVLHESNGKYAKVFNNQELCFIKSAGNYVEVYSNKNGIIKPTLLRNSFKNIGSQVTTSGTIIKCHRTYMVNTSMVVSVEGNSQGYKVRIKDYELEIPVSRSYTKDIQERINQMQFE